jgi:hypothetical protein
VTAFNRAVFGAGILAGIGGLVVLSLYGLIVGVAHGLAPGAALALTLAYAARVIVGPGTPLETGSVSLVVFVTLLVAIGWGIGFALVAQSRRQLIARPITSGIGFGVIIFFFMQLVFVGVNAFVQPGPNNAVIALCGSSFFFGVPVATIVARLAKRT